MKTKGMAIITAFVLLTGCSTDTMSELKEPTHETAVEKPTLDARVETSGRSATVIVATNLKISKDHVGQKRIQGEGHIHLYIDSGEKIAMIDNKYVIEDLQHGKHKVSISLHNNDHTPYDVAKQIKFEIK